MFSACEQLLTDTVRRIKKPRSNRSNNSHSSGQSSGQNNTSQTPFNALDPNRVNGTTHQTNGAGLGANGTSNPGMSQPSFFSFGGNTHGAPAFQFGANAASSNENQSVAFAPPTSNAFVSAPTSAFTFQAQRPPTNDSKWSIPNGSSKGSGLFSQLALNTQKPAQKPMAPPPKLGQGGDRELMYDESSPSFSQMVAANERKSAAQNAGTLQAPQAVRAPLNPQNLRAHQDTDAEMSRWQQRQVASPQPTSGGSLLGSLKSSTGPPPSGLSLGSVGQQVNNLLIHAGSAGQSSAGSGLGNGTDLKGSGPGGEQMQAQQQMQQQTQQQSAPPPNTAAPISFGLQGGTEEPKEAPALSASLPGLGAPEGQEQSAAAPTAQPSVNFGQPSDSQIKNTSATPLFGASQLFGGQQSQKQATATPASQPSFTFGLPGQGQDKKTPAAPLFGASHGFGAQQSQEPAVATPAARPPTFTFGLPSQNQDKKTAAAPLFGGSQGVGAQQNQEPTAVTPAPPPAFASGQPNQGQNVGSSHVPPFTSVQGFGGQQGQQQSATTRTAQPVTIPFEQPSQSSSVALQRQAPAQAAAGETTQVDEGAQKQPAPVTSDQEEVVTLTSAPTQERTNSIPSPERPPNQEHQAPLSSDNKANSFSVFGVASKVQQDAEDRKIPKALTGPPIKIPESTLRAREALRQSPVSQVFTMPKASQKGTQDKAAKEKEMEEKAVMEAAAKEAAGKEAAAKEAAAKEDAAKKAAADLSMRDTHAASLAGPSAATATTTSMLSAYTTTAEAAPVAAPSTPVAATRQQVAVPTPPTDLVRPGDLKSWKAHGNSAGKKPASPAGSSPRLPSPPAVTPSAPVQKPLEKAASTKPAVSNGSDSPPPSAPAGSASKESVFAGFGAAPKVSSEDKKGPSGGELESAPAQQPTATAAGKERAKPGPSSSQLVNPFAAAAAKPIFAGYRDGAATSTTDSRSNPSEDSDLRPTAPGQNTRTIDQRLFNPAASALTPTNSAAPVQQAQLPLFQAQLSGARTHKRSGSELEEPSERRRGFFFDTPAENTQPSTQNPQPVMVQTSAPAIHSPTPTTQPWGQNTQVPAQHTQATTQKIDLVEPPRSPSPDDRPVSAPKRQKVSQGSLDSAAQAQQPLPSISQSTFQNTQPLGQSGFPQSPSQGSQSLAGLGQRPRPSFPQSQIQTPQPLYQGGFIHSTSSNNFFGHLGSSQPQPTSSSDNKSISARSDTDMKSQSSRSDPNDTMQGYQPGVSQAPVANTSNAQAQPQPALAYSTHQQDSYQPQSTTATSFPATTQTHVHFSPTQASSQPQPTTFFSFPGQTQSQTSFNTTQANSQPQPTTFTSFPGHTQNQTHFNTIQASTQPDPSSHVPSVFASPSLQQSQPQSYSAVPSGSIFVAAAQPQVLSGTTQNQPQSATGNYFGHLTQSQSHSVATPSQPQHSAQVFSAPAQSQDQSEVGQAQAQSDTQIPVNNAAPTQPSSRAQTAVVDSTPFLAPAKRSEETTLKLNIQPDPSLSAASRSAKDVSDILLWTASQLMPPSIPEGLSEKQREQYIFMFRMYTLDSGYSWYKSQVQQFGNLDERVRRADLYYANFSFAIYRLAGDNLEDFDPSHPFQAAARAESPRKRKRCVHQGRDLVKARREQLGSTAPGQDSSRKTEKGEDTNAAVEEEKADGVEKEETEAVAPAAPGRSIFDRLEMDESGQPRREAATEPPAPSHSALEAAPVADARAEDSAKTTGSEKPQSIFSFSKAQQEAPKPLFSFGSTASSGAALPAPAPTKQQDAPKSLFSFANTASTSAALPAPTPSKGAPKPFFTLTNVSSDDTDAPVEAEASAESAGAEPDSQPAFTKNIFGYLNPKLAQPKLGSLAAAPGSVLSSAVTSRATTPGLTTGEESNAEGGGEEGGAATPPEKQLDLSGASAGEENEEVLMSVRAKASAYVSGENIWATKGVGELRVLKDKEGGKVRVVLRADTTGKVVMNAALVAGATYDKAAAKLVNFPMATEGGVQRWLLRTGEEAPATQLSKLLEENKKN